jgi:hypothetical protein
MAYFPPRDQRPAEYCTAKLSRADLYVGVIGIRYGSPVPHRTGLSYVELEFESATAFGLSRLIFLICQRSPHLPSIRQSAEHRLRQLAFRRRLAAHSGLTVAQVISPVDVEIGLLCALSELDAGGSIQRVPARRSSRVVPVHRRLA